MAEIKEACPIDTHPTMLDQTCVRIEDFIPMCRECDGQPATKVVMLDALNNGMCVSFGQEMCGDCAEEAAKLLRESLPAPTTECEHMLIIGNRKHYCGLEKEHEGSHHGHSGVEWGE